MDGNQVDTGRPASLAVGGQVTSSSISWTGTLSAGSHRIDLMADSGYEVTEPNETNNSKTQNITVAAPSYALTVTKSGTGSGTVTSSPTGINCGSTCSASFTSGTTVTLTASAASGSAFAGWSGACSGTGSCSVSMSAAKSVGAVFNTSGQPDLEATSITVTPSSPTTSDTVTITGVITNVGAASSPAFTWILAVDGNQVDTGRPASLAVGGQVTSSSVSWTGTLAAGSHRIDLMADSGYEVTEPNETNNSKTQNVTVTASSATFSISGKVKSRRFPYSGIPGVLVQSGKGQTVTTAWDGTYTLMSVPAGATTVTASHGDYWASGTATAASQPVNLVSNATGIDFLDFACRGTSQVTLTADRSSAGPGDVINVTVSLKNVNYSLSAVTAYLDLSFSDARVAVDAPVGAGWSSLRPYPVGSTIWKVDSAGSASQITSTEYLVSAQRDGAFAYNSVYSFTVPLRVKAEATPGTLTLKYRGTIGDERDPDSTGSGTRDQQGYNVLSTDVIITTVPGSYSVSGSVRSRRFPYSGVPGALVQADTGQSATTAADGTYILAAVPSGTRTITAAHADYWATGTATLATQTLSLSANAPGVNFSDFACKGTAQVSLTTDRTTASPGDVINVTVSLKNTNYSLSNVVSYLDLSFSDTRVTVGPPTQQGTVWTALTPYPVGSTIWRIDSSGVPSQAEATEYLVSAERDGSFATNGTYAFTVPLTVRQNASTGILTLRYRGTIGDERDPDSTGAGTLDQQGYNVRTATVEIAGTTGPRTFGTTVITHGQNLKLTPTGVWYPYDCLPAWLFTMADAIKTRAGGGRILVYDPSTGAFVDHYSRSGCSVSWTSDPPTEGETILIFDWTVDTASWEQEGTSEAAAEALVAALMAGRNEGLLSLNPLHLIGHSRGTVVMSETAQRLLKLKASVAADIDVEQVTYLDPHPTYDGDNSVNNANEPDPGPVVAWAGIHYVDDYWQSDEYPAGRSVPGAAVNEITGRLRFDADQANKGDMHSEVHAWYYGTIETTAISDGDGLTIAENAWYGEERGFRRRDQDGFYFSRLGGGAAARSAFPSTPLGDVQFDLGSPREGIFNGDFEAEPSEDVSIPGWTLHGGGGDGRLIQHWGGKWLLGSDLSLGPDARVRRHNRIYFPPNARRLRFRMKVPTPSASPGANADKLEILVGDVVVGSTSLYPATPWEEASVDIAEYAGSVQTFSFRFKPAPGSEGTASVVIDDVGFDLASAPAMPSPIAPADNASVSNLTPSFQWSAFQPGDQGYGQAGYQLRVRSDSDGDLIVYDTGFIASPGASSHTYQPGAYSGDDPVTGGRRYSYALAYGKRYHWHVRYRDESGAWTPWSADQIARHQDFFTVAPSAAAIGTTGSNSQVAVPVGANAAERTFEVWNAGTGSLEYVITSNQTWVYPSPASGSSTGEHDLVTLVFNTAGVAAGSHSAVITIGKQGGGLTPVTFQINLSVETPPAIEVAPGSRDFGAVAVGSAALMPFTVRNVGGGTLRGSVVTESPFSVSNAAAYDLGAGESQIVNIRFAPNAVASFSAMVSFTGGAGVTRPVMGIGVQQASPVLRATPASLAFGEVVVGGYADQTLLLQNIGTGTLTGTAAATSPFVVVGNENYSIEPGMSVYVVVRYAPTAATTSNGTVTLSGGGGASIAATGTGTGTVGAPSLSVVPGSLDFGTVTIGQVVELSFRVKNGGSGILTGNASTAAPFQVVLGSAYSLAANEEQSVTIRFTPTTEAAVNGTVAFSGGGGAVAAVSGIGQNPVLRSLTLSRAGAGSGRVFSSPAGIDCGSACAASFADHSVVTLTATPDGSSYFAGWSGDCSGSQSSCEVSMTRARSVTATFLPSSAGTRSVSVTRSGTGAGSIVSVPAGISCGTGCYAAFPEGATIHLYATALPGSHFVGWTGDCLGTDSCSVTTSADRSVNAEFALDVVPSCYPVTVEANPAVAGLAERQNGPSCGGGDPAGTAIPILATPAAGYSFAGWTAVGCTLAAAANPSTNCTVSGTGAVTIVGNFTATQGGSTCAWSAAADMPTARTGSPAAIAVVRGKISVIGSHDGNPGAGTYNEEYDPSTNTWKSNTAYPRGDGRYGQGSDAVVGDSIYLIGGTNIWGNYNTQTVDTFNPVTNTWTLDLATYPAPVSGLATTSWSGKIYCFGGGPYGGRAYTNAYKFDTVAKSFTALPAMPTARYWAKAFVVDGKIWVAGGFDAYPFEVKATIDVFDPVTETWSSGPALPRTVDETNWVGITVGGDIHAVYDDGTPVVYRLDRQTGTWAPLCTTNVAQLSFGVATVSSRLHFIGGGDPKMKTHQVLDSGGASASGRLVLSRQGNLWLTDTNGGNPIQLTSGGADSKPRLANGVVTFARSGSLYKTDTAGVTPVLVPNSANVLEYDLKPDGSKIVLTHSPSNFDLYTMNVDGSGKVRINAQSNMHQLYPGWGRDGFIYFGQSVFGDAYSQKIHRIPEGGVDNPTRLVDYFTQVPLPGGPNGRVAFFYNQPAPKLRVMNADGSGQMDVPNTPAGLETLKVGGYDYTDDVIYYVYASNVYRVRADGTDLRQLTTTGDVAGADYGTVPGAAPMACFPLAALANPSAGGTVTVSTAQDCGTGYTAGKSVSLVAAAGAGMEFAGWNATGCTLSSTTAASTACSVGGTGPAVVIGSFRPALVPSVSRIVPNASPAAGGITVTITGSGFNPGVAVTFGGTPATGVVHVSETTIRATVPAHAAGVVDVVVTNPGLQAGTLPGGFYYSPPVVGTRWYPLPPCRVFDTRNASGPLGGPVLAAQEVRQVDVVTTTPTCGIPSDAVSLTGNITVDAPTQAGDLRLYASDAIWTGTSVLSFRGGRTRANNMILKLPTDRSGLLKVVNASGGTVHAIFDVNGYFK